MKYNPPDISFITLSANPIHAGLDRKLAKQLKFREVHAFASLAEARPILTGSAEQILIVDSLLRDMDGCECLRTIHKDRDIHAKAMVMITTESSEPYVLNAISAGASGYVIRPYSLETLERHIKTAWQSSSVDEIEDEQLERGQHLISQQQFDEAIDEFSELVSDEDEALSYFNKGMEHLRQNKFGKAILAFNKALALNKMYAEAYRGLAHAHKGKGDDGQYQEFLKKSADIFALQDKLHELKEVFVEILKADPEAVNPYNTMGVNLRRSGDYMGALHAYNQALVVTPSDENLMYNIAKAYIYAGDKEKAANHLRRALDLRPDFIEANKLLSKISGEAVSFAGNTGESTSSGLLLD